jgi:hypothetical protein
MTAAECEKPQERQPASCEVGKQEAITRDCRDTRTRYFRHQDFGIREKHHPGVVSVKLDVMVAKEIEALTRKAVRDFKERSLGALPTLLERLAYICSLQTEAGTYDHWGLRRIFGEEAAHDAILEAHNEAAMELIRTPVREIYKEYQEAVGRQEGPRVLRPESLVLTAPVNGDELLSAHLRLLQESTAAVAHQERTNPPGA